MPGLRTAAVGVHVRAFNDQGHILACCLPVARIQLYNGRREADRTWRAYDQAWAKAKALKARVVAFLEAIAAEKVFAIRAAGVIDIGAARPLRASWNSDPALARRDWLLERPQLANSMGSLGIAKLS